MGEYVGDETYGICDRESKCGYKKFPNPNVENSSTIQIPEKPILEPSYLKNTEIIGGRGDDNLFKFIASKFGEQRTREVFELYDVRSTNYKWQNSTIFYLIDSDGKYRTGKLMAYNKETGGRIKEPYNHFYWLHSKIDNFNYVGTIFGGNLINNASADSIRLVESEKSALICALQYPEYTWVASGGLNNLGLRSLAPLIGKRAIAYPDVGGTDIWKKKLEPLGITVSTILETSNMKQGEDIADNILKDL